MARKYVRIGSLQNIHIFDDGDFDGGIETDDTIKAYQAPTAGEDVLRLDDVGVTGVIAGPGASTDHAIVRWSGVSGLELLNSLITISDAGQLRLLTTARVYRHIRVAAPSWSPGVAGPTSNIVGIFPTLAFDAASDDEVLYSLFVPYRLAAGSEIGVGIDWCYTGGADAGTVCWGIEYKSIMAGEALVGGTTTRTETSPGGHTSGQLVRTTLTTGVTGTVAHDVLGIRLYRDVSADTLATDAELIEVHFEILMDKLGEPT